MSPEPFRSFDTPGFAKAVWNFSLASQPNGVASVSTNKRLNCLNDIGGRRFRLSWLFIRRFSGGIRLAAFTAIEHDVMKNPASIEQKINGQSAKKSFCILFLFDDIKQISSSTGRLAEAIRMQTRVDRVIG